MKGVLVVLLVAMALVSAYEDFLAWDRPEDPFRYAIDLRRLRRGYASYNNMGSALHAVNRGLDSEETGPRIYAPAGSD